MNTVTGTGYFYNRARDRMSALTAEADKLQGQIATRKQLGTASDDAAGWQRLQTLVQAKADAGAYGGNVTLARAVLDGTDSTLTTVQDRLNRASELTLQARTGTMSASDRAIVAEELDGLVADLAALAQTKDARGQPLFDAAAAAIPIDDGIAVIANEDPARVFGTIGAALGDFATTLRGGDAAAIEAAGGTMLTAIADRSAAVTAVQGAVGARAARVELVAGSADGAAETVEAQRAAIEDTDLSSAIADLQRTMTVLDATQASFSKLTDLSLFNYLR